jgi:hypothetical protein
LSKIVLAVPSLFLAFALGACNGAAPDAETSTAAPATPEPTTAAAGDAPPPGGDLQAPGPASAGSLPPVAAMADAKCVRNSDQFSSCTAGGYQIEITPQGCSADGFYGAVSSDTAPSVDLMDGLSEEQQVVARLPAGQFVCTMASASKPGEEASWHYVMAIPAESVPACKGKTVCTQNQGGQIEWIKPASGTPCRWTSSGYAGDCAAGWVRSEEFGEFSMGL